MRSVIALCTMCDYTAMRLLRQGTIDSQPGMQTLYKLQSLNQRLHSHIVYNLNTLNIIRARAAPGGAHATALRRLTREEER